MKPLVYLCGPINGCTDSEASDWREAFKEMYGGPTLDPMRRDYRGSEFSSYREIVELDEWAALLRREISAAPLRRDIPAAPLLTAKTVLPPL